MRCLLPLLALVLAACAPAPAAPSSLPPAADPAAMAAVRVERVELPGFPEEHTPATLNRAVFLRYRAPGAVGARAVVVFVPGLFGGASGFDRLARGIVALEPGVEAWAVDRRANLLEDHAALREATDRNDPLVAWRHYVRDAGKPAGFSPVAGGEAPYAGYWGLETAIGDLRVVVTEARRVAPRVVLAGHSLGATLSAQYAGWDFAGRAGHEDLAGLVLLDGAPGAGGFASVSEASYRDGSGGPFGSRIAGVRDLEAGKASPFLAAPGFDAAGFARATAAAFLAARDPGGDSPGGVVPYPASNLAAAMLQVDDDYALVETFSATAGRADASVGPNLLALFTRGLGGLRVASVLGPAPGARRVEWVMPAPGDARELSDPLALVRSFWTPQADWTEWYFPLRLTLDAAAAGLQAPPWAREKLRVTRLAGMPILVLALVGTRGIARDEGAFQPLEAVTGSPVRRVVLPGYTHLDVLTARSTLVAAEIAAFAR